MSDFTDLFSGAIDWATANPGLTGAAVGGIGALLDPAQAATTSTQQSVQLPDYIAPYVGSMLNSAQGLAANPYQTYDQPRIADFNADQQQAFQNTRDMNNTTPEQQQGAGIVGQAANSLLQNGNRTWDQNAAQQYMSPYLQSVLDAQKSNMYQGYGKQLLDLNGSAAKAGAFGGDRQAILQGEAQRNFNNSLNQTVANGYNTAYTNAQGAFNNDMSRNNSALSAAGSAGQTLAGIGQQGFQNQLAVNQNLMGIGNQQQGLEQKSLDTGYSDFTKQQQYPYQQLQFMQQMLQGLPMTQTQTANTTPAPSLSQQLVGSGIGGYLLGSQP